MIDSFFLFYYPESVKSFSAMQMRGAKPPLWPSLQGDGNEADALR
jgi:hypothetical protein